jgi:hypothetical protein
MLRRSVQNKLGVFTHRVFYHWEIALFWYNSKIKWLFFLSGSGKES